MNNILNNKFLVIFLIPALLGATTILSFPPYNLTFINFFAFSCLLYLILVVKKKTQTTYRKKKSKRYFFYLGCSFGFGFFLIGNYWITISLTHDEIFKGLIPFALVLIPLFLSIFFGLAILISSSFAKNKIFFILIFSLSFSIFEFLRGNLLTGFPWNLFAYSWSWSLETIQLLSLIGTYGLSLLSITFFCIPFLFFQKDFLKKNIIFSVFFIIIFLGNYYYGSQKIVKSKFKFDENLAVKIISPNFSLKDYQENNEEFQLKRLIQISNPEENKKTIFIWPEGVFYESNLQNIEFYKDLFSKKFNENHLIVVGINNVINKSNSQIKKYYNSFAIVNHKLEILYVYNKINLVPFGEFLPIENIFTKFGFKKISFGYNSFSPGEKRILFNLGNDFNKKVILPLICYEIIYSGKVKQNSQLPDLLINISEDAWFGQSIGPHQHFVKAIYRAVEEGIFIARSANKGISAVINPNGEIKKSLNTRESGSIQLNFPHFSHSTLFSHYGNKIFYLIIFLYMFLILIFKKYKI